MKDYADKSWLNCEAKKALTNAQKLRQAREKMGGMFGYESGEMYTSAEHTDIRKTFRKHIRVEAF